MKTKNKFIQFIDWPLVSIVLILISIGWISIFSATYDIYHKNIVFSYNSKYFKQLIWILVSAFYSIFILNIDTRIYQSLGHIFYFGSIILLLGTLLLGKTYGGHNSWYKIGLIHLQPGEISKITTSILLAKVLSQTNLKLSVFINNLIIAPIIFLPMCIILLQGDAGSALVYFAFIVPLYVENIPSKWVFFVFITFISILITFIFSINVMLILIFCYSIIRIGIEQKSFTHIIRTIFNSFLIGGFVFIIDFGIKKFLKPHQKDRIKMFIDPTLDPKGKGWNVTQSKIAIGSGGLFGKGMLKGIHTNLGFVPAKMTDFIFCNIAEEYGWAGATFIILIYIMLFLKIIHVAERQKSKFGRIYSYSVLGILLVHFIINIGMTIGLAPVIGIPLPFISYGGSSLISFVTMICILLRLDYERISYQSNKNFFN